MTHAARDCGLLDGPEGGKIAYSDGTTEGSQATYNCIAGVRMCQSDGIWSVEEFNCDGKLITIVMSMPAIISFTV